MSQGEDSKSKGTQYGFPELSGRLPEDTQRGRPELPAPHRKPPPAEPAAQDDGEGPLLRRVEHELAQPARFTAQTETGRSALGAGLLPHVEPPTASPADGPPPSRPDLLRAPAPSLVSQAINAVTWTRTRLLVTIGVTVALIGLTLLFAAWRCGVWSAHPAPVARVVAPPAHPARPAASPRHVAIPPRPPAPPPKKHAAAAVAPAAGPTSPAALAAALTRAREHAEHNRCAEAAEAFARLVGQPLPDADRATAHYFLGRSSACLSRFDAALAAYRRAVALQPALRKDRRLLEDLGFMLTQPPIRRAAAAFLAEAIGAPARTLLLGAATNEDRAVRQTAVTALQKLGAGSRIDWQTVHWLDLQQAPCAERAAIVARIAKLPRSRAQQLLHSARKAPEHACVRAQIDAALAALK